MSAETGVLIVYCTVPDDETARMLSERLVNERLCACVTRTGPVTSHYVYDGTYHEDEEIVLTIKTTRQGFDALAERIEALHPYEVPEIVAVPAARVNAAYAAWVHENVRQEMRAPLV